MEVGGAVTSAAKRRRERRLRSWWRHEAQSVRAAVTTFLHHSCDVGREAYDVPRNQKMVTAREVEEQVSYSGLRAPNTPPPRERPGCLVDPGPQRSDRTVRRSAGDSLPTPGLPVLAGASGEKLAEKEKEKAEKELQQARRLRKAMREAGFPHCPWLPSDDGTHWHNTETNETRPYPPSSSSGARRKRKKRRRKRTRRSSHVPRRLPGCPPSLSTCSPCT